MHPTTTRLHEKLQVIKAKPQHVRQNIAVGISGGITLLVFVGWLGALSNNNTFALTHGTGTEVPNPVQKVADAKDTFTSLLGAAGSAFGATTSPSEIKIVDTQAPRPDPTSQPEQTVIHF